MFFKKLLCKHIWKEEEVKFCRNISVMNNNGAFIEYQKYKIFARYQHCIKCNKKRLVEDRELII